MFSIFANNALLETGWAKDVRLDVEDGKIASITTSTTSQPDDRKVDRLLPALANVHSHSFQRAMAGMTEFRAAGRDNFWTWRELMYRFVDHINPAQIEAIASLVFVEMQEAGYASVGEFHYIHHQRGGQPYDALAELSHRIFAAADISGIGLTHLPVLYTYGGVDKTALAGGQQRFGNDISQFHRLVGEAKDGMQYLPADSGIGIAPHSLRATSPKDLANLLSEYPTGPIHMHIAEQVKEVADVEAWLGARPVAWLLDNAPVDNRWCLIHATHMTDAETVAMAKSGAVAGLCPITEANLGDGPFNGPRYLEYGGAFALGSDSNVRVSLTEELRSLEYAQRLRDMARNVMAVGEGSVGHALYVGAAAGGAQALGRNAGAIRTGSLADLVAIDGNAASLCALNDRQILDGLVFAANDAVVTDVWSAGRHQVQDGKHIHRDRILANYRAAISQLLAVI
jgi:formiminoglutamate deiminase